MVSSSLFASAVAHDLDIVVKGNFFFHSFLFMTIPTKQF